MTEDKREPGRDASQSNAAVEYPELNEHERTALNKGECPDCRAHDRWQKGPSAGLCTNWRCGICGSRFNLGPFYAERISQPYDLLDEILLKSLGGTPARASVRIFPDVSADVVYRGSPERIVAKIVHQKLDNRVLDLSGLAMPAKDLLTVELAPFATFPDLNVARWFTLKWFARGTGWVEQHPEPQGRLRLIPGQKVDMLIAAETRTVHAARIHDVDPVGFIFHQQEDQHVVSPMANFDGSLGSIGTFPDVHGARWFALNWFERIPPLGMPAQYQRVPGSWL